MRNTFRTAAYLLALAVTLAPACSHDTTPDTAAGKPGQPSDPNLKSQAESFESDLPSGTSSSGGRNASAAAPESAGAADSLSGSFDATRAIVEADIIQVAGQRLYALSRAAGLTVIDLTDPAHLQILGRYRELNGQPFEMYLQDGVVLAMYSSWGQYVKQADGKYSWVQTSKVLALDVENSAAISLLGSFDVAGEVSDSRIVGNVLYVVGYQSGYCWGCDQNKPQTSVLSLNIADPRHVVKVDELKYGDSDQTYGWSKRSITVTAQRMYVAGPEYGQTQPTGSTVQVVDISDPSGDLVEGASFRVAGQISSRWQMDEYQGVLRVISQTPTWSQTRAAPLVQTFKVDSSSSLTALGSTALVIPPNEVLNTVRFDGARGYAITSERKDPLFTIDLSDPAHPRQAGEVVMPGWIYHLEPRGNRLVGLGYDQGNPAGAITVSLFDVTSLDAPALLDRVNFGGDWGYLPEDQDRIHKAFKVLDDQGLILAPFSGWSSNSKTEGYCYDNYRSGVQLVDLAGDDLILRGAAPSRGEARRALVFAQKLLTVSDEAVDSYDISDRAKPVAIGRLSIARNVSHALPLANGTVARINDDWYASQNSTIDFVDLAQVERPDVSRGELNLSQLLSGSELCSSYAYIDHAFVRGNQLFVTYQRWGQKNTPGNDYVSVQTRGVLAIDASDPSKPSVLSKLESLQESSEQYWYDFSNYYRYGYNTAQLSVVLTDHALVFAEERYLSYDSTGARYQRRLRVVDLTDPSQPSESFLSVPDAAGYAGLVADGGDVLLSHYDLSSSTDKGRFYVDRVDLSTPGKPVIASKVNVPGTLLHYDRAHGRMLNSELVRTVVPNVTAEACFSRFAFADFDYPTNGYTDGSELRTCTGYTQKLHLVRFVDGGAVRDDSYQLGERERLSSSSLGDARIAAVISKGYAGWYGYPISDCFDCGGFYGGYGGYGGASEPVELLSLSGLDTGHLAVGRLSVASLQDPWWGFWGAPPVYVSGTRALVQSQSDAVVVDLTDPAAPSIVREVPLLGSARSLEASGNLVLLALGMNGVQRVDL